MQDANISMVPVLMQDANISMVPVRTQKVPSCDNAFKNYKDCLKDNDKDFCIALFSDPKYQSSACAKCVITNKDNIDVCVSKDKQAFRDVYNTAKQRYES